MQLLGDARSKLGDVTDDADCPAPLPKGVEDGQHLLEALFVERAETLVDEKCLQVEAPGLGANGVTQPQCQRQRGHEGLASRQRGRLARLPGPGVPHQQPKAAPSPPGCSGVGVLQRVAAIGHRPEAFVGQGGDLCQASRQDV